VETLRSAVTIDSKLMITSLEKSILETLVALDEAVKGLRTAGSKPDLGSVFTRLDELAAQLPPGTDPNLQHYMRKKSYQKAMYFLQGRDAENVQGSCGHV
jgi:hypothetical protein